MPDTAFPPVHPGEILLKEYLKPLRTRQNCLARAPGVPALPLHDR